jgi:hypothetical protein
VSPNPDPNPPPGTFTLHSTAIPALPAGRYTVHGEQVVTAPDSTPQVVDATVEVTAPRFTLPADQLLSTFPPNQAEGAFSSRLPQVVLKRRTLPWERELDGNPDVTSTLPRNLPWLALVVLADAEAELRTARPIAECVTTGVNLAGDNDATVADCIVVTERVVQQVFPTKAELPLLSHVRRVDLNDTELALGDDDGWMAVVLSNRLPQPGVRYQACLISLEGQYGALPDSAAVAGSFSHTYVYADAALAYDALSAQYSRTVDRSATFTSRPAAPTLAIGAAPAVAASTVPSATARAGAAVAAPASGARSLTVRDGWSGVGGSGISLAATAAGAAVTHTSALIGDMHGVPMQVIDPVARQLTFPVLAHWQFTCTGSGDFQSLMQALDVGMLGTPPQPAPVPKPGEKPPAPPSRPPVEVLDTGHVALSHTSREGETGTVWYRGPLTPRPTSRQVPDPQTGLLPLAHASDQVRRVGPDGRENLGLATAFDIGRLLALAEPSVVAALLAWRKDALERARTAALLAREPSLGRLTAGAVITALGARAGRDLLAGLGANRAGRLGPLRPLDTPGRPIAGVDDADPVQLLSAGLGVPAEVVKGLLTADPAGRQTVDVTVVDRLSDPVKLAATATRELGPLRAATTGVAADLAAQALKDAGVPATPGGPALAAAQPDALDLLLDRLASVSEGEH